MNEPMKVEKVFEGQPLAAYFWEGKPVWIAKEVGRVMGYRDEGRGLVDQIRQEWKGELIEGTDFELLEGERLAKFKEGLGSNAPQATPEERLSGITGYPEQNTSPLQATYHGLLLLKEPGFYLVCIKTDKPIGRRLRRWLADEVMPSLLRTGAYRVDSRSAEEVFAAYFAAYNPAVLAPVAKLAAEVHQKAAKMYLKLVSISEIKPESEPAPPKEPIMREKIEALDREHPHLGYTEIARRLGTTRGYISRVLRRLTPPKN